MWLIDGLKQYSQRPDGSSGHQPTHQYHSSCRHPKHTELFLKLQAPASCSATQLRNHSEAPHDLALTPTDGFSYRHHLFSSPMLSPPHYFSTPSLTNSLDWEAPSSPVFKVPFSSTSLHLQGWGEKMMAVSLEGNLMDLLETDWSPYWNREPDPSSYQSQIARWALPGLSVDLLFC